MKGNDLFKIKQDALSHLLLISIAALFAAASFHLLTGDFSDSHFAKYMEWLIVPAGILGLTFFSFATIYCVYRVFKFKYLLTVNKDGFTDYSTMGSFGYTSWKDVISIRIFTLSKQKLIGVYVKDIEKLLVNTPWYVKKLTKADIAIGYPPITINLNSAKEKPEEVLVIMNKYWNEWKKNNEKEKTESGI